MKVSTMRLIDRWLGVPVCFVLTVIRKCLDILPFIKKGKPEKVKSILIVKLAEQGATVLADASLRRAVEIAGKENVYFLVFQQNRFILDLMNIIPAQNVIAIPDKSFISLLIGTIKALRRTKKLHIDAAVDFEFFARSSAILTYLSDAEIRVGLYGFGGGSPYRGDLMTHRINYNPHLHAGRMFETMVEAVNLNPKNMPQLDMNLPQSSPVLSRFVPGDEELGKFKESLEKHAGTKNYSPLILLNANASDMLPLRRWPCERYVELAKRLIEKLPDVHIAFTGGPEEAASVEKLLKQVNSSRCFSMAGKTTLRELMTLYTLADVLVTNDSGPAHFATLTDIEVVTLFGPETPKLFGAQTPRSHILHKDIPCSPCVSAYNNRYSSCKNNICVQRISVDEVYSLVCGLVKVRSNR